MLPCKKYGLLIALILTFAGVAPFVSLAQDQEAAATKPEEKADPDAPAKPDSTDWKKGEWGDLSQYIGTYQYDAVMKDKRVAKVIGNLIKDSKIDLASYFETKTPIGFEDDCLILQGNATNRADIQSGIMTVCLYKGTIHIATQLEDKITVYSPYTNYAYLSERMRIWIYFRANPKTDITTKPDQVQFSIRVE
jgi:hypothetical protein